MAVRYWIGTDAGNEGDWQTAANWSGAAVPVADDEVIFDDRSTQSVTDGIAVDETGGVDFDLLHIKEGFTGDIGASTERLHTSADKIIVEGSGTYYIEISENTIGQDQATPLTIINNKKATVYLTSNENTATWSCEFTEVLVTAGTVYIGDSNIDTAVKYLRLMPRDNITSNVTVTVHEDCLRIKATTYRMSIYMANGTLLCDSRLALLEQYNGIATYGSDLGASPETDMNIMMLRLYGGILNWHPDDSDDDAYIYQGYIYGGLLDASSSTNNNRIKFLGDGAGGDIFLFKGGILNIANGRGNITIKAGSQFWNFGGIVFVDNNTQLAVTYDEP